MKGKGQGISELHRDGPAASILSAVSELCTELQLKCLY